jgi:amidase
MTRELVRLGAAELAGLLLRGEVKPSEAVEASIARIEAVDTKLNALPVHCFDRARAQARRLDTTPPTQRGVLGGMPIVVKDNNDVGGVVTSGGTAIFRDRLPVASDRTIALLEKNGAIPVAKANLSELGGANTTNRLLGTTLHPMDLSLSCGGSSGGSAVAVATGQVWVAHGNDVGGSLRIPPAFAGITGLRPTPGRVPRLATRDPFDPVMVDGPLARNVEDLALMFDAMVGLDAGDPMSAPSPDAPFLPAARAPLNKPARVAISASPGGLPVAREIRDAMDRLASQLAAGGMQVKAAEPACDGARDHVAVLRGEAYALSWESLYHQLPREAFTPEVQGDIERGFTQPPERVRTAHRWRNDLARRVAAFWTDHDFFICPATQAMPFPVGDVYVRAIDGEPMRHYTDWITIDYMWSLVGCPLIALPVRTGAEGRGLPIGVQVMGPPRSEAALFAFGAWWEREICAPAQVIDPRI